MVRNLTKKKDKKKKADFHKYINVQYSEANYQKLLTFLFNKIYLLFVFVFQKLHYYFVTHGVQLLLQKFIKIYIKPIYIYNIYIY